MSDLLSGEHWTLYTYLEVHDIEILGLGATPLTAQVKLEEFPKFFCVKFTSEIGAGK